MHKIIKQLLLSRSGWKLVLVYALILVGFGVIGSCLGPGGAFILVLPLGLSFPAMFLAGFLSFGNDNVAIILWGFFAILQWYCIGLMGDYFDRKKLEKLDKVV